MKIVALVSCALALPTFTSAQTSTISRLIKTDKRFTMLSKLMKTTGMDTNLSSKTHTYTLLAPTDDAFRKLPPSALKHILNEDEFGAAVIMSLTLDKNYSTLSYINGTSKPGEPLRHHLVNKLVYHIETESRRAGLFINGAKVIDQIFAQNGTILVVDKVPEMIITQPRPSGFSIGIRSEYYNWKMARYYKPSKSS